MVVARHSGRDAGIQSQGCETVDYRVYKIKHLRNRKVTVHGSGFRHPGRNDGVLAKMRIAGFSEIQCVSLTYEVSAMATTMVHVLKLALLGSYSELFG